MLDYIECFIAETQLSVYPLRIVTSGRALTRNLRTLMAARGCTAKDVAFYCRHSEPWISRLLADRHKKIAFIDLDCLADFFKVEVAELFRPERRKSRGTYRGPERRSGEDRRRP